MGKKLLICSVLIFIGSYFRILSDLGWFGDVMRLDSFIFFIISIYLFLRDKYFSKDKKTTDWFLIILYGLAALVTLFMFVFWWIRSIVSNI